MSNRYDSRSECGLLKRALFVQSCEILDEDRFQAHFRTGLPSHGRSQIGELEETLIEMERSSQDSWKAPQAMGR